MRASGRVAVSLLAPGKVEGNGQAGKALQEVRRSALWHRPWRVRGPVQGAASEARRERPGSEGQARHVRVAGAQTFPAHGHRRPATEREAAPLKGGGSVKR